MLSDSRWDEFARVYKNWYGHFWDDTIDSVRRRWSAGVDVRGIGLEGITNPSRCFGRAVERVVVWYRVGHGQ